MNFEVGRIYEMDEGWGYLRITEMFQVYDSFNPDEPGEKIVRLSNVNDEKGPFRMKFETFEELAIKNHGYHINTDEGPD